REKRTGPRTRADVPARRPVPRARLDVPVGAVLLHAVLTLQTLVRLDHPVVLASGLNGLLPRPPHLRLQLPACAIGHRAPPARNLGPRGGTRHRSCRGLQGTPARIGRLTPGGPAPDQRPHSAAARSSESRRAQKSAAPTTGAAQG